MFFGLNGAQLPLIAVVFVLALQIMENPQFVKSRSLGSLLSAVLKPSLVLFAVLFSAASVANASAEEAVARKPNIIVILADDMGYGDLGCQGTVEDVRTPHIDTLAEHGVRFTQAYVTAPQCGPSRAALLSGRYQNRFGFESNEWAYNPGMPRSVSLISERLKEQGDYATGYIGKWGITSKRHSYPPKRGFDESYWGQDGNIYFPDTPSKYNTQMKRGMEPIELDTYSTDAFGREAIDFIERHEDEPFFLLISYITPHEPMEAKESDLERFAHIEDPLRRTTLAMIACMDDNVGNMLELLKEKGLEEDTLIFFLSDNGGYPGNGSLNTPYRGTKSQMLEGGIHVPFLMQWKGQLPEGKVYEEVVSSLDIVPTTLAVAGVEAQPEWQLDGVNLLPYIVGRADGVPHETLFWRYKAWSKKPEQDGWAIRKGEWMLVRNGWAKAAPALYHLADDPEQREDLSRTQPERYDDMLKLWSRWDQGNAVPGSITK